MRTLYEEVLTEIQGKVEEIYIYFQEMFEINSGDQPIELALKENEAVHYLAGTITETLKAQKGDETL